MFGRFFKYTNLLTIKFCMCKKELIMKLDCLATNIFIRCCGIYRYQLPERSVSVLIIEILICQQYYLSEAKYYWFLTC